MDGVHGSALVSYNAGISACEKGEQWQRALALLSEMWEVKLEPNVVFYTTIPGSARSKGAVVAFHGRQSSGAAPGRPRHLQDASKTAPEDPDAPKDGPDTLQIGPR